jgi:Arc/MetJ-type ribon-helix-helix transcriptional regulator
MTVESGGELLDVSKAGSHLQTLRDLVTEGLNSGASETWSKDAFLQRVKGKLHGRDSTQKAGCQ